MTIYYILSSCLAGTVLSTVQTLFHHPILSSPTPRDGYSLSPCCRWGGLGLYEAYPVPFPGTCPLSDLPISWGARKMPISDNLNLGSEGKGDWLRDTQWRNTTTRMESWPVDSYLAADEGQGVSLGGRIPLGWILVQWCHWSSWGLRDWGQGGSWMTGTPAPLAEPPVQGQGGQPGMNTGGPRSWEKILERSNLLCV